MNLKIEDLQSISALKQIGIENLAPNRTFREVSTDSRTLKRDDLFIALRGEKFDGHDFLDRVFEAGAIAAVVDEKWYKTHGRSQKKNTLPLLVVKNTLDSYGELAHHYRKKFKIPILVVAGSNGKTTTKEIVAHVLGSVMDVLKTEANYNNQIGLPRMLLQLRDGHDIAVLEIGTNHPGEIEWLAKVAEPTHVLVTNIGREHLEFLKDLKGVAKEEMSAFDIVNALDGFAFINNDDKYLRTAQKQFGERCVLYGTTPEASISSTRLGFTKDGRVELRVGAEGKSFKLRTYLVADYAANLISAAVAVGLHFDMRRAEIKAAIEHFKPHNKRLEVQRLSSGITVLNDAYNANPDSMDSAFRTLSGFPAPGRKYAVLGDMFELGETSAKEHRLLGKKIAEFSFNKVYFTGKDMQAAWKSFIKASEKEDKSEFHDSKSELANALKSILEPGDAVLIKGSRGMKMEEVIELLQR